MAMLKIKKGDTVKVIAGKDKDKEGKVIAVDHKNGRVTVCLLYTSIARAMDLFLHHGKCKKMHFYI